MTKLYLYVVIALVVGVGAGFFGGMKYQQSKVPFFNGNFQPGMMRDGSRTTGLRQNGSRTGVPSGGRVMGEVLKMDESSLTVKMPDGSTKNVIITQATTYTKTESGDKVDLKEGISVGVFGITNTDGSVTATDIQINPRRNN